MKKLLLFLALAVLPAKAAIVTISVTFTNALGPLQTNTFTRNGTVVTYTNTPLNSTTWIRTNNAALAATGLWNHLGANMPQWYTRMQNATNVTITGSDAQFSIAHAGFPQYALLTTNTGGGGTNSHFLSLSEDWTNPQKFQPYATNKTNDASELLALQKRYALDAAKKVFFSNELYLAPRLADGSSTNVFITNAPSIHATNIDAEVLLVRNSATITNLTGWGTTFFPDGVNAGNVLNLGQQWDFNADTGTGRLWLEDTDTGNTLVQFFGADGTIFTQPLTVSNHTVLRSNLTVNGTGALAVASISLLSQRGPITLTEGAYSTLTGGSNNVVQAATNFWTRLSGQAAACNVNSLRTGDGLPMSERLIGVINGGGFDLTFITESGYETLATNRLSLVNSINLPPGTRALFSYDTTVSRWVPAVMPGFALGSTNQISFGATNLPPANTSVVRKWISVTVTGETNAYRLPLYE